LSRITKASDGTRTDVVFANITQQRLITAYDGSGTSTTSIS
jgi:hypothetical protein